MRTILAVITSFFLCTAPAAACSMADGYKTPTNFELVEKSKVIVLARVDQVPDHATADGKSNRLISLQPLKFLKGSAKQDALELMGWRPPKNWEGVSTSTTLWQSHFSAGLGACIRQFYQPGELVVAMFAEDPQSKQITGKDLNQLFAAWARIVETVDGPDDVWVHAVERYVALQAGDPATAKQRIESEVQKLRLERTPEAQAIAADLDYYLRRGDRSGTWGSFAMPTLTVAAVDGQTGAQFYCVAGTPPGVMLATNSTSQPPQILIDGARHVTTAAEPTPVERAMLNPPKRLPGEKSENAQAPSIYRLNASQTLAALRMATKDVAIETAGGRIVGGPPLDALLRWVSQCDKLQTLPAPTERELRRP